MKKLILTTFVLVIVIVNGHSQNLLIQHCGFTFSYNCYHLIANWVSWTLTKSHVLKATVERSSTFYPGPSVPSRYRVTSSDYFQWLDDTIESRLESHSRLQDWK